MKRITLLLFLLAAVGVLMAETITLSPSPELYNLFPAAYVDPTDPMSQPILFYATITGTSSTTDYRIIISIEWNGNVLLSEGTVDTKQPAFSNKSDYTSRDIIAEQNMYFEDGSFDFDDIMSNNPDFEDAILDTGRFPDGSYTVNIQLKNLNSNQIVAGDDLTFNIISPISIQLLYPGTQIGGDVPPYLEAFPNFIWASNLRCYQFSLWELEGGISITAEEVENMTPIFTVDCGSSTTLPYPPDAPTLEVGGAYAWQVQGGLYSPASQRDPGTHMVNQPSEYIKSPVFVFRVANANDNAVYNQILANFLNNLDIENLSEVYELLSQGFTPTGAIIFMGQEMSFEELNALLMQILNGDITVTNLIIE